MKPPAFQFYVDDFIGGTCDMTAEDVGAYIRLLCFQWGRGSIPEEKAKLDRIAGCEVSADVLAKFPDGKNHRMELVRAERNAWIEKCRTGGKASAESRKGSSTTLPRVVPRVVELEGQLNGNTPSPSPISTHTVAFAERPSLEEVKTAAQFIGLAPWKAEDWFNEMEGGGWLDYNHRPVANWRAVLSRVKAKWEAEGRPASPPSGKLNGKPGMPNAAPRIGPSLAAVQEYARDKDDGTKRALGYAVSWWQAWEGRGWKRDGKSIDWQIEFAKAVQGHLQRQSA